MLDLTNIKEFIKFTIELFQDEFYQMISPYDAKQYFVSGGCFELAQVVHYFFPDGKYILKKDGSHVAILYAGEIYDAFITFTPEELQPYGVVLPQKLEDYTMNFDLNSLYDNMGRNLHLDGKTVSEIIIFELQNIPSIILPNATRGK